MGEALRACGHAPRGAGWRALPAGEYDAPVLTLCIGSGPTLAMARELVTQRGHAVVDVLRADGADGVAEVLTRISTPDLALVEAADRGSAARLVSAVRSHVRGEAAGLLALVPEEALEAALGAGADLALPSPTSRSVLAAAIASLGRGVRPERAAGEGSDAGQDIYFLRNPNPMWFFDVDTLRFVAVNDAAVQKYGYSREEFLAMTIKEIRPPEELDRLLRVTGRVERGLNTTPGWRHRARDGRIFHVEIISYPVRYAGRSCELVLAHDVTERVEAARELEELRAQLTISDRMASIGTLASGVAHEINNPLTWIVANLAFAAEQLPAFQAPSDEAGRAVRDAILEAAAGARRVKTIVGDLKTFSRGDEEALGPVELRAVVAAAIGVASSELSHRAGVVVDVGGAPPVLANEARLGQVILNLIVNAAHALPDGDAARQEIRITAAREGDRVSLVVSDTGPGIEPAIAGRIFEPFFTTKPVGQGTGLGLWVSRRVIGELGGSIELLPSTGKGAAFRVLLPVAPAGPPAPVAQSAAPAPRPTRRPRVLVVDDEPMVGRALLRAIGSAADVQLETSASDAVARIARGERYDLILADVMMPAMPGAEFHAALERLDPAVAAGVVFMTGGAFTPREQEFLARVPNLVLEKPVDVGRLRDLVSAAGLPPPEPRRAR